VDELARFAMAKTLFDAVCDLPEAEREAYLAASGTDTELLGRVRALLVRDIGDTQRFAAPIAGLLGALSGAEELQPGTVLGAWTLTEKVGEGGMGTVYAARRSDGHFEQTAAIKVLRGVPSPAGLEFLARERQILASLAHPNIAGLRDGGSTPQGQPYLVMEFLDGIAIDLYCREHKLATAAILRLLLPVCDAVSFAHSRLIVHCDLKPSNILVAADGRPRLLDFGIARLLGNEASEDRPSSISQRVRAFTPGFASPEQESGGTVSTVSDVYSLGRLYAELLGAERLTGDAELRAIAARATQQNADARYPSAAALAQDIERYLARQPLQALPGKAGYRARKWLQRRWPVALAAAIFALTVLGFALQLVAERDRALSAQESAQQVSEFLVSVFEQADPDVNRGNAISARDLLDNGVRRIDALAAADASAQAQLYEALGRIYQNLGLTDPALGLYQRALTAHEQLREPQLARRLGLYRRLADAYENKGDMDAAQTFLTQAQSLLDAHPELPRRELALLLRSRANHLQQRGDAPAAARELTRVFAILEKIGEADTETYAQTLQLRSASLLELGKPSEALVVLERAYAIRRKVLGEEHTQTVFTLGQIGRAQRDLGDKTAALKTLNAVMDMRLRVLGPRHPDIAQSANELANFYHDEVNVAEAERYYRMALDINRSSGGEQSVSTTFVLNNLAILLESAGRFEEAEPLYRESIAIRRKHAGKDDGLRVVKAEQNYAVLLSKLSRYDEAIPLFENAIALRIAELGPDHLDTRIARANLDSARYQQAPSAAAAERARQSWLELIALLHDQPPLRAQFELKLANLLLDAGRLGEAEVAFRTVLASLASQDSAASINIAMAELGLGMVLASTGRADEGRPMIARTRTLAEPILAPNSSLRRQLHEFDAGATGKAAIGAPQR